MSGGVTINTGASLSMLKHSMKEPIVSPDYEDAGLFSGNICQISVELVPQMRRTDRDDLVVRGFVNGNREVEVLFAGRRARNVGPLETRLKGLLTRARQAAEAARQEVPDVDRVRCPVRIEGAWRRKTFRDESGWETHSYNFVAARWSLLNKDGQSVSFGEPPAVSPRNIA